MKKLSKILVLLLVFAMVAGCLAACNTAGNGEDTTQAEATTEKVEATDTESSSSEETTEEKSEETTEVETKEFIDYASEAKFNKNSGKVYAEVKVHEERNGVRSRFGPEQRRTPLPVSRRTAPEEGSHLLQKTLLNSLPVYQP